MTEPGWPSRATNRIGSTAPLCRYGRGRFYGARLLDLSVHMRLVNPEGTQLTLHEGGKPGPVVPVELLQRLDLPLQRFTFGGQAPHHVVITLLGSMLELVGIRLGFFGNLVCLCQRIGERLVSVSPGIVGVRLRISDYLLRRCACVRKRLVGFPPKIVGVRLDVPDYLLRRGARIRADLVRLTMSTGNVVLGCSLGQVQHLESLTLGVGVGKRIGGKVIGKGIRLVLRLIDRWPSEQSLNTALHPTIGHRTTSVRERFYTRLAPGRLPLSTRFGRTGDPVVSAGVRTGITGAWGRDVIKLSRIVRVVKHDVTRKPRGVRRSHPHVTRTVA